MKIKNILLVALFFANGILFATDWDSLYYRFLEIKTGAKYLPEKYDEEYSPRPKSGTSIINIVKVNLNKFNDTQKGIILPLLSRPYLQASIVSPRQKFRIHYDTVGVNKPAFSISKIAEILDSVYAFEVDYLGYTPPPSDFNIGGDNLYDIYIENQSGGIYGYTETENGLPGNTYTTFMVIDNDFTGYYSEGLNGLRVTVAHEFHHAIQIGSYIFREEDIFYYEITSTAMEEFVFDYVNDYIYYVKSLMYTPNKNFKSYNYNYALWNIYLKERFGYNIIKRTWELMRTKTALDAISAAIDEYGSTFKAELNTFGAWLYFSGYRAKPNKYFKDARLFPALKLSMSYSFNPPLQTIGFNTYPTSNNFLKFGNSADTVVTVVTNGNFDNNINTWVDFNLRSNFADGFIKISDNYYYKFSVPEADKNYFSSSVILNDSVSYNNTLNKISYVYPQPFSYKDYSNEGINFPVKEKTDVEVNLYIYDVNMNLLFSGAFNFKSGLNPYINWNGVTNNGKLKSGIYIYVTESAGKILKGKFAVLND